MNIFYGLMISASKQEGTRNVGSRGLRWLQGAVNDIQGLKVK